MAAGQEAVSLIRDCFSKGISFNQETTLCGKSIIRNILKAKSLGYTIELYYVGLESPSLAIERVAQRVKAGGHGIPDKDIERRYYESLENLKQILPVCDFARVYDNTDSFCQIAAFKSGKCINIKEDIPDWFKTIVVCSEESM